MIITKDNCHIIDKELYIHDSYFNKIQYDCDHRKLILNLDNVYLRKKFEIRCHNVSLVQMQNFNFYCINDHCVLDWNVLEDTEIINHIVQKEVIRNAPAALQMDLVKQIPDMIHSCFYMSSGDTLEILCEEIEFIEQELEA